MICRRTLLLVVAPAVASLLALAPADAACTGNFDGQNDVCFVDNACEHNGDGMAEGCASTPGAPGAFNALQGCIGAMSGGDLCLIKDGVSHESGSAYTCPSQFPGSIVIPACNFCETNPDNNRSTSHPNRLSGSPGNYTEIKGYPGHQPRICTNPDCLPYDGGRDSSGGTPNRRSGSIGVMSEDGGCNYIRFQNLKITGGWTARTGVVPENDMNHHIELLDSEVSGGWYCDGNYNLVRIERAKRVRVRNNLLHDMNRGTCTCGGGCDNTAAGIKVFNSFDNVYEYNTIDGQTGGQQNGMVFGIDEKDTAIRSTIRYNEIIAVNEAGVRVNGQTTGPQPPRDVRIHNNLVIQPHSNSRCMAKDQCSAVRLDNGMDDVRIYHNTFIGAKRGVVSYCGGSCAPFTSVSLRDNIIENPSMSNILVNSYSWSEISTWDFQNNGYSSESSYHSDCWPGPCDRQNEISGWQTRLQNAECNGSSENRCERGSFEGADACHFVNNTGDRDGDYHISGGECLTASSTGGEIGAYAAGACPGRDCDSSPPPPTPPADVTGVVRTDVR